MSMQYIRKHYGVPAKRGGKVRFAPYGNRYLACEGVIGGYAQALFGAEPVNVANPHGETDRPLLSPPDNHHVSWQPF